MPLSLYVHIPFCLKRCIYCDFVSGIYNQEKADAYIEALKREISLIPSSSRFSTLYIGGGTPTVLSSAVLKELIEHIFDSLNFTEDHEATIEANPGTLKLGELRVLKDAGMNRISIGVQSFNDDELKLLSRVHTYAEAEDAVVLSREAGFDNIGIDLIYGIPGQSMDSWVRTVATAAALRPEHVSAYELTVEKGTELASLIEKGELATLGEELIAEMYYHTIDRLKSSGFEHYEISNFAKPGYQSRHNLNYWERGGYYGVGLGAHSFINNKRIANITDPERYLSALSQGRSPTAESETIDKKQALSEEIFLGLRKIDGIDLEMLSGKYKLDILSSYQKDIKDMLNAGLIETTGSKIKLTRRGLILSNEVFMRFV